MPETTVTGGPLWAGMAYPGPISFGTPAPADRSQATRAGFDLPCTCGTPAVRDGACSYCPSCGWSSCSG